MPVTYRVGRPADADAAVRVWRRANTARRAGRPTSPQEEQRARSYLDKPGAFLQVAEQDGLLIGMALGMPGLARDGAGGPVPGLCHVAMVFVEPDRWGAGVGRRLLTAVVREARARGYRRAQLWTQADNVRAQRLYEGQGWTRSGRTKVDDGGEPIVHYELDDLARPRETP